MSKARDLADNALGSKPKVVDAKADLIVGTGADAASRLAVASTAGYVLTVDSDETTGLKWAASTSPGLVLLGSTTLTTVGTSGVAIDSVFTSAYSNYKIIFKLTDASTTIYVNFQLRATGTPVTTGYKSQYFAAENTSSNIQIDVSGTDEFFATFAYGTPYRGSIATVEIQSPEEARETWVTSTFSAVNTAGTPLVGLMGGCLDNNNQYDGILIKPSTGTISGEVYVYGYKK